MDGHNKHLHLWNPQSYRLSQRKYAELGPPPVDLLHPRATWSYSISSVHRSFPDSRLRTCQLWPYSQHSSQAQWGPEPWARLSAYQKPVVHLDGRWYIQARGASLPKLPPRMVWSVSVEHQWHQISLFRPYSSTRRVLLLGCPFRDTQESSDYWLDPRQP